MVKSKLLAVNYQADDYMEITASHAPKKKKKASVY